MDTHSTGFIIWLTGMNRAGKSTLAAHLAKRLGAAGRPVELLDENGAAAVLLEGLGASKEDHAKAVARLGLVAKAVARAGGIAVCGALLPAAGFVTCTVVLLILALRLGRVAWATTLVTAVVGSVACYALFTRLGMPLPAGILPF